MEAVFITEVPEKTLGAWLYALKQRTVTQFAPSFVLADKAYCELCRAHGRAQQHGVPPYGRAQKCAAKNTGMLTHEEALKLICLLEEYAGRPGAQAVHLLPAGAGKSEILHARRQEVHLRRAVPAARTVHVGRNGFIPLSQEAAGVVRRLPRRKDAPRLLPRRRESSHVCFLCLESPAPMPEENGISPS